MMTVPAKSQDIEFVLCTTSYDFTLNVQSMFRYRGNLVKFVGSRKAVKKFPMNNGDSFEFLRKHLGCRC